MDNRATSAVLGYVMVLGIVTLLISGLLLAGGSYVEAQQERATRSEFEVIGNRVAADIAAVDRLGLAAGSTGEAVLTTDLPPTAAGNPYRIQIRPVPGTDTVYSISVSTAALSVVVDVRVKTKTPMVNSTIAGGGFRVRYNGTHIEVQHA